MKLTATSSPRVHASFSRAGRAWLSRTELLTNDSTTYARPSIDDYAKQTKEIVAAWKSMDGKQGGESAKLADAIVRLVALEQPPTRFAAGADAVQTFEAKANALLTQAEAHRGLSTSLAYRRRLSNSVASLPATPNPRR